MAQEINYFLPRELIQIIKGFVDSPQDLARLRRVSRCCLEQISALDIETLWREKKLSSPRVIASSADLQNQVQHLLYKVSPERAGALLCRFTDGTFIHINLWEGKNPTTFYQEKVCYFLPSASIGKIGMPLQPILGQEIQNSRYLISANGLSPETAMMCSKLELFLQKQLQLMATIREILDVGFPILVAYALKTIVSAVF